MKICWDTLERVKFTKQGNFKIGTAVYTEENSCKNCNEPYLRVKARKNELFCSNSCSMIGKNNHFYGKRHTRKSIEKIKKGNKDNSYWFGKNLSDEHKDKIRQVHIGKPKFGNRGKGNGRWNPNKNIDLIIKQRKIPGYDEWRMEVFERDEFKCKKCGEHTRDLNAHHIYSYHNNSDKRIDVKNGITFCEKCHNNFHHTYGIKNNMKQLKEFLNE